jgi:hypothetical protein
LPSLDCLKSHWARGVRKLALLESVRKYAAKRVAENSLQYMNESQAHAVNKIYKKNGQCLEVAKLIVSYFSPSLECLNVRLVRSV